MQKNHIDHLAVNRADVPTAASEDAPTTVADIASTALGTPPNQCVVCGKPHGFTWTDTHGVGVCYSCGMPYTIFHYEGDVRVDKPPTCALAETGIALAKRYWAEEHRTVFPGAYDMGLFGGHDRTYSGASQDDMNAFQLWYDKQPEVIEARAADTSIKE